MCAGSRTQARSALTFDEINGDHEQWLSCPRRPAHKCIQRHQVRASRDLHHDPDRLVHERLAMGDGRVGRCRYRVSHTLGEAHASLPTGHGYSRHPRTVSRLLLCVPSARQGNLESMAVLALKGVETAAVVVVLILLLVVKTFAQSGRFWRWVQRRRG
jgi:hypothetical protein